MSKRLSELLRQRTLLQEHLAWLDREIAAEQSGTPASPPPLPSPLPAAQTSPQEPRPSPPVSSPTPAPSSTSTSELPADVEKIVDTHRRDPGSLTEDTRRGCLRIFWMGFSLMLALAALVYWLYARHLGRWW